MQVSRISYLSHNYPEALREIKPAPKELYVLGKFPAEPSSLPGLLVNKIGS